CRLACLMQCLCLRSVSFFNDTATTNIYTLSLHDALPIYPNQVISREQLVQQLYPLDEKEVSDRTIDVHIRNLREKLEQDSTKPRSEEHTSELQSRENLVCRLLLEKKKKIKQHIKGQELKL